MNKLHLTLVSKILFAQILLYVAIMFGAGFVTQAFEWSLLIIIPAAAVGLALALIGLVGLTWSIYLYGVKKVRERLLVVLFITSVLLTTVVPALYLGAPVASLGGYLGDMVKPTFRKQLSTMLNNKLEADTKTAYEELSKLEGREFTVRDVQFQLILTEEGFVYQVFEGNLSEPVAQSLIGKKITIALPSYEYFSTHYGGHSGVFYDTKNRTYYDIPAIIYLDGQDIRTL